MKSKKRAVTKKPKSKPTSKPKSKAKAKPKRAPKRMQKQGSVSASERLVKASGTMIENLKIVRFAGIALGGGKTDKTAVAVVDYYPERKRVFLRSLRENIGSRGEMTADEILLEILNEEEKNLDAIAIDAPLQLPISIRCDFEKQGEKTEAQVIAWMKDMHQKRSKDKRPNKMFTPYTERACEIYIAHELEESFHPPAALGANAAPLTARAYYLSKKIKAPLMEAYPKLSLWRIGQSLAIPKSYLRFHSHSVDSDEARHYILKTLIEKEIAFIYQQDLRAMVENDIAFEALICALTAFLKHRGQTEKRPPTFPKAEMWIDYPIENIRWF